MSTFQFLNDKFTILSKKKQIVNFIIQKLKSKHNSLKKYKNREKLNMFFSRFEGMTFEKTQIFCTKVAKKPL